MDEPILICSVKKGARIAVCNGVIFIAEPDERLRKLIPDLHEKSGYRVEYVDGSVDPEFPFPPG